MTDDLGGEVAEYLVEFVRASELYDVQTGERQPYRLPRRVDR